MRCSESNVTGNFRLKRHFFADMFRYSNGNAISKFPFGIHAKERIALAGLSIRRFAFMAANFGRNACVQLCIQSFRGAKERGIGAVTGDAEISEKPTGSGCHDRRSSGYVVEGFPADVDATFGRTVLAANAARAVIDRVMNKV